WSAAFISYVVRQAGVGPDAFHFSNAHRAYIYDAFATSVAEVAGERSDRIYRACPLATRPRIGDMICAQREPALADMSDETVRERVRGELAGSPDARSIRRSHCEVVAYVDAGARKVYSIGGNVNQAGPAPKAQPAPGRRVPRREKGQLHGRGPWGPAAAVGAGRGRSAAGREMLAQRQDMVRAAATEIN